MARCMPLPRRTEARPCGAHERPVIVRIWHGITARDRADRYEAFLIGRAIPDYRAIPGNLDASILRRDEAQVSHFLTVTRWSSADAISAFAGSDALKAKYYPEDQEFLLEFEPSVQHYIVAATASHGSNAPSA